MERTVCQRIPQGELHICVGANNSAAEEVLNSLGWPNVQYSLNVAQNFMGQGELKGTSALSQVLGNLGYQIGRYIQGFLLSVGQMAVGVVRTAGHG